MIENWQEDLRTEKSLREVFIKSKTLLSSRFNKYAVRITILLSTVFSIFVVISGNWRLPLALTGTLSDIAFDLTVQILGFLIGGFAIFATVSDRKLMIMLAQAPYREGISVFKAIFFNFLSVFYIYVVTLALSVVVKLGLRFDIQIDQNFLGIYTSNIIALSNSLAVVFLSASVSLCLLRIKSFIWNIYQAFVVFLETDDIKDQIEGRTKA